MKEKYTITLLDKQVNIVSDEDEETVRSLAKKLNDRINNVLWKSRQVSKTEAVLFCALEALGDCENANKKLAKATAQLELYADNITRLREENNRIQKRIDELEARHKNK